MGPSRGLVARVTSLAMVGTAIEWYDFFIASTAASLVFPRVFFPPTVEPGLALLYSLATVYLVSFLVRPLSAFLFGHLGDRLGRKVGLVWNLLLMGVGTLLIGLAPSYGEAGYLGLGLVMAGRVLQGLGLGGEWGGAATLVVEQAYAAGSRWRAFWASWIQQGVPIGLLWASGTFSLLSALYPGDAFYAFGWRIAYYVGAAAVVVGALLRYLLVESIPFEEARRAAGLARAPSLEVWRHHWREVALGTLAFAVEVLAFYLASSYATAYMAGLGISRDLALRSITATAVVGLLLIPIYAVLGDRFGRRPVMLAVNLATIPVAVAYPLLLMSREPAAVLLAQVLLWGATQSGVYAVVAAFLPEQFPTRYRYSGSGLAYNLGAALGGGLGPIAVAALVGASYAERWWGVTAVLTAYAVVAILALLPMKGRKTLEGVRGPRP